MEEQTVKPLLLRVADGDPEAMNELFYCAQRPLLRMFYRLSRSTAQADDLVQGTFLRLWSYRKTYRGQGARSYIYRVAFNEWQTNLARDKKQASAHDEYAKTIQRQEAKSAAVKVEIEEVRQHIRQAVESLPETQREAFILHRIEGLNCREIAEVLGQPRKTIESRLRLAIQKLTQKLREEEPGQ